MYERFQEHLASELKCIEEAGLYKHERLITTPQGAHVGVSEGEVLNLCANNYLGLAQHPAGPTLRDPEPLTSMRHGSPPPGRAQNFPSVTSLRIWLSTVRSATARLSLAFSASSSFMRLA